MEVIATAVSSTPLHLAPEKRDINSHTNSGTEREGSPRHRMNEDILSRQLTLVSEEYPYNLLDFSFQKHSEEFPCRAPSTPERLDHFRSGVGDPCYSTGHCRHVP